jgi:hypothetical protein
LSQSLFFKTPWISIGAAVGLFLAYGLIAWSLVTSHQGLCAGRDKSLLVLRQIIVLAQNETLQSGQSGPNKMRAIKFYQEALAEIDQAKC